MTFRLRVRIARRTYYQTGMSAFSKPTRKWISIFIDNGDNTLTIPEQEEEFIDDEVATIRGSGVVDPVTREIIFTVTLVDFDDQPEVSIVYKPI